MTMQFNLFNTHSVYVTLDDNEIYKFERNDLTKIKVNEIPRPTKENPILVLHKFQFDLAKDYLMNVSNPFRIDLGTAETYNKIGFITDEELQRYKIDYFENEHNIDDL